PGGKLSGELLLQEAFEFDALLVIQQLIHPLLAVAQHGAVILPEIIEHRLDLLRLDGRKVQFSLQPFEVERLARSRIKHRGARPVMDPEVHPQSARSRAAEEHCRQGHNTNNLGIDSPHGGTVQQTSADHRPLTLRAYYLEPARTRMRESPAVPAGLPVKPRLP